MTRGDLTMENVHHGRLPLRPLPMTTMLVALWKQHWENTFYRIRRVSDDPYDDEQRMMNNCEPLLAALPCMLAGV